LHRHYIDSTIEYETVGNEYKCDSINYDEGVIS